MTVGQILKGLLLVRLSRAERLEWLKMALCSQFVALGLWARALHYDLIVLEKRASDSSHPNGAPPLA
jgi:hypothetical protein